MTFIIKMMDGAKIEITDDEFQKLSGRSGSVFIPSVQQIVNLNSVSQILSKQDYELEIEKRIDRSKQKEGILHDGTIVVRQFGSWYLKGDIDENGKHYRIIDPTYYPEVARDCVPTQKEFYEKYANLPRAERLKLIIEGTREPRKGGFARLKDINNNFVVKI